jgi:hypothetical protein
MFASYFVQKAKFDFDQTHMEFFRRKILSELLFASEPQIVPPEESDHSDVECLDDDPSPQQHLREQQITMDKNIENSKSLSDKNIENSKKNFKSLFAVS